MVRPDRRTLARRPAICPTSWAGKRLAELSVPGEVTLVAVVRAGVARLDVANLVGQDGDVLHLLITHGALGRLRSRLGSATPTTDRPPSRAPATSGSDGAGDGPG